MQRAITEQSSTGAGTVSIRTIRQKIEASRSRTKAPFLPIAL
jgi:hypothetical protein